MVASATEAAIKSYSRMSVPRCVQQSLFQTAFSSLGKKLHICLGRWISLWDVAFVYIFILRESCHGVLPQTAGVLPRLLLFPLLRPALASSHVLYDLKNAPFNSGVSLDHLLLTYFLTEAKLVLMFCGLMGQEVISGRS